MTWTQNRKVSLEVMWNEYHDHSNLTDDECDDTLNRILVALAYLDERLQRGR